MDENVKMSGYEKLKKAVEKDCRGRDGCNESSEGTSCEYCEKFKWAVDRAKHYAEELSLSWEDVLNSWEENREYWYMNYYQNCNQPEIKGDKVRVFDTVEELLESVGSHGFRCPACNGVSKSPYKCTSGITKDGKVCDWKVYGLFGGLGKGIFVYCKDKLHGENFFMPIAWEKEHAGGSNGENKRDV